MVANAVNFNLSSIRFAKLSPGLRLSHGIPLSFAYVEFDMKTAHLNPHCFVSSLFRKHTHTHMELGRKGWRDESV